ncbi:MAG: IS1/IS1595 family N-terminal zinc-binding domain-containing protein [Candidatus Electronema sp. VV]
MKQYIEIKCRHCGAEDLVKNGRSENGTQRYRCSKCKKSFQHDYTCNAWKPGVKEQIEMQTSKNTVISELKKKSRRGESALRGVPERTVALRVGN